MSPDEVAVGQEVEVRWKRLEHSENGTVTEVYPSRPDLVRVEFRDGVENVCSVAQLTLLAEVAS